MPSLTDCRVFDESKLCIGEEEITKKKDNTENVKIQLTYDDRKLLLPIKTKTMGVKTVDTRNGYKRMTMPFVFEEPLSKKQNSFIATFKNIVRVVHQQLSSRLYEEERLSKLGSCLWAGRILYTNVVQSIWDSSDNTRFFLLGKEVQAKDISDCTDYEASGAVSIDSIYVGETAIILQVRLYEVHLTPAEKRARVVWD